jgi:type VII secretion-associated protein (TIGR03931 family)
MAPAVSVTAALVGPGTVRPVCDSSCTAAALAGIDDEFAMTDRGPVAVAMLWRKLFDTVLDADAATLVCPSWWSERRIAVVSDAARTVAGDVAAVRRATVLASNSARRPAIVLEIAESFVALTRPPDERPVQVVPREGHPQDVAEQLASAVSGRGLVVIDRPDGVGGASELSALIADRLRRSRVPVTVVGDDQLLRAAQSQADHADPPRSAAADRAATSRRAWPAVAALAAAGLLAVAVVSGAGPRTSTSPTTLLVEGRVVVEVPATWPARRIAAGPGSSRVQVTSPTDSRAAVHITQSPVPGDETLERTAETLQRALLEQPPGVFVDFNADDRSGGRPAVTYREIRDKRDIRWSVFLDGRVRISIGCQSAHGSEDAVRAVCDRAVASAREFSEPAGTVAPQPRSNTA